MLLSVKHPGLGGALAALGDVPSVTRGARFGPAARLAAARTAGAARAAAPTRGFSRSAGAGARLFVQPCSSCSAPCGSRLQCGTGFPWCTRRVCPEAGGSFGSKARGITNNAVRGNELPSFLPHSLAIDFSAFSAPFPLPLSDSCWQHVAGRCGPGSRSTDTAGSCTGAVMSRTPDVCYCPI